MVAGGYLTVITCENVTANINIKISLHSVKTINSYLLAFVYNEHW